MNRYAEFVLHSNSDIALLETLEISHPMFSQSYFIVRNAIEGITATLETGVQQRFEYYPMKIDRLASRDNLDSGLRVTFGDLGEILPKEIDRVRAGDGFSIDIKGIFRVYRSDDLSSPLEAPLTLVIPEMSFNAEGSMFDSKAPSLNVNKTGILYSYTPFKGLRGFI